MNEHLSEKALARRLSISHRTLQRWRQEGIGPGYLKIGHRVVYPLDMVEAWEKSCSKSPSSS